VHNTQASGRRGYGFDRHTSSNVLVVNDLVGFATGVFHARSSQRLVTRSAQFDLAVAYANVQYRLSMYRRPL
jgi:hypothetical protein